MLPPLPRQLNGDGAVTSRTAARLFPVQVRFQAHTKLGGAPPYRTSFHGYAAILREEGLIAGLYRG